MKERYRILIVDDETANLQKLRRTFIDEFEVHEAQSGEEALGVLRRHPIAVIVTDQRMPAMSGVELLRRSLEISPDSIRIILTGYTEVDDLMEAINRGHVQRYITKPWEPFSLKQTVLQDLERWELKRENERLGEELRQANEALQRENFKLRQEMELLKDSSRPLIYKSRSMQEVVQMLDRVVHADSTVLLQGETGTGKELLARYVHEHSHRRDQPFVPVNCGAIPSELVESSFFGHRKGAFTGATENRKGFFELAHQGTLFLDEIGEAPIELQVKLLRVLQEREIFPVGAQQAVEVDVRIVTSTNRNLARLVEEGKFRQDLYFRLNVFSIHVPPLRARPEDTEALAHSFLEQFRTRLNREVPGFEPATLELLRQYPWPGNVRELQNEIERMAILAEPDRPLSPVLLSDRIRFNSSPDGQPGSLRKRLATLERKLILEALKQCRNNKSQAAEMLGITRQTIIAKLKQYSSR